eukprot:TRINITY_DN17874_c5_g1_i2.p1 TRINITY_DN17874_c5_g1~~TRINITY_DN17874_c5_g1_i2.p1  ORF type:complete len:181 (+),score=28.86 TRINITY_DN17874_c5_g1_i2:28-543(+)
MSLNTMSTFSEKGEIDWVALTDKNILEHRQLKRGKSGRASSDSIRQLSVVTDESLSLPVGRSVIPHSTASHHGVVAVKATPYSSIIVTQKPWGSGHSWSAKSSRELCRPPSPKRHQSLVPREMASEWENENTKIVNKKSLPDMRRERRILSRMITSQMRSVRDLPLPELFE